MPTPHAQSHLTLRNVFVAALLMGALAAHGCAPLPKFMRQCSAASARAPGNDPAGCWSGYWLSQKSGHKGCLKAAITHCGGSRYHVRFHATFFKFFSYAYETVIDAHDASDGMFHFTGQKDLGKLAGGMYYYDGTTDATTFRATYRCCKDCGIFVMTRQSCCSNGCGASCGGCDAACGDACPASCGTSCGATP